jgi:hypothetical protein
MTSSVPSNMFTSAEITKHRNSLAAFSDAAADFLDWVYADHIAFFNKWGVSKYYGNRKPEHQTKALRIAQLKKYGKPVSLADLQVATACVTLAMQAMEHGFNATGMPGTWKKINNQMKIGQKYFGTDLQIMLQQLGWKVYYWNPDPTKNAEWDAEDRSLNPPKSEGAWRPEWGGHALRYASVKNKGFYYDVKVDNSTKLVGFKKAPSPDFKNVPIFVATAHAGFHVFPGRTGDVIEAHSMRWMNSIENIEFSKFNPMATGGGPRWTATLKYRSGLICVPSDF